MGSWTSRKHENRKDEKISETNQVLPQTVNLNEI
jgi:hypothetical protein